MLIGHEAVPQGRRRRGRIPCLIPLVVRGCRYPGREHERPRRSGRQRDVRGRRRHPLRRGLWACRSGTHGRRPLPPPAVPSVLGGDHSVHKLLSLIIIVDRL